MSKFDTASFVSVGRMIVNVKLSIPEESAYTEDFSDFLGTQAALMQSDLVINRANARVIAQKPEMMMQPVSLKVSVLPKTTIFSLQATGQDPQYTQAFLQACMEEYINLKKEMFTQTSDSTVAGLTEELLQLQKELRKSDDELAAIQSTNSVVLSGEEGSITENYLASLEQSLATMKSEYGLLQALTLDQNIERQQQAPDAFVKPEDPLNQPGSDSTSSAYLNAKQEIQVLKADQQELGQYLKPNHPKMIALNENIAQEERLLEFYRKQSAEQLESSKRSLALQIQNREQNVTEWTERVLEINRKTAEYEKLKANSQRIQALYDHLLGTMQTLDINKEISPESVTILENALPAYSQIPGLSKRLLVGALVGLGAGILLLLLLDRLDDRVNTVTELQDLFEETILGQISKERRPAPDQDIGLLQPEDVRHYFVEAFRSLRSMLFYMSDPGEHPKPKTILLTSSVPREGKSLIAANLAITMANTGSRVLLVDADLRVGMLHNRFEETAEPGFSEILSQNLDWNDIVRTTKIPNLFLLPRGAVTFNSSALFISESCQKFLREASAKFDYVLLDAAPVMVADDVTSLAPNMDGVAFVIRAEYTSARIARTALQLLYHRRVHLLGLIFNDVRFSRANNYYRDYYRYTVRKDSVSQS
ncbi:MAG: polysaccharide biosynthesis tyrosine autokinase [Verrucomicrobiota bacterium]